MYHQINVNKNYVIRYYKRRQIKEINFNEYKSEYSMDAKIFFGFCIFFVGSITSQKE